MQTLSNDRADMPGQEQMETFESSWPEGFYNTIKRQVVTFSGNRKAVKIGDVTIVVQKAIYARVISLKVSQRDVDFGQVLSFELAAYPPSFLPEVGARLPLRREYKRPCTQKSTPLGVFAGVNSL